MLQCPVMMIERGDTVEKGEFSYSRYTKLELTKLFNVFAELEDDLCGVCDMRCNGCEYSLMIEELRNAMFAISNEIYGRTQNETEIH